MHDCHHDEGVGTFPKKNTEREGLGKTAADIEFNDRVEIGVSREPVDGILNCNQEPSAEVGLLRLVIGGCLHHLGFRVRMEPYYFHVSVANALANTVSASRSSTALRSISEQRRRSSSRHLADSGGVAGASRLSMSFSAMKARKGGGSSSASITRLSTVVSMPPLYHFLSPRQAAFFVRSRGTPDRRHEAAVCGMEGIFPCDQNRQKCRLYDFVRGAGGDRESASGDKRDACDNLFNPAYAKQTHVTGLVFGRLGARTHG